MSRPSPVDAPDIGQAGHFPEAHPAQGVVELVEALEALERNNNALADQVVERAPGERLVEIAVETLASDGELRVPGGRSFG